MKNIRSDLKIIVVGNTNTGKTSFVNKWTKNQFSESYKATIVSEFGYKIFEKNGKIYRIQIWDLAGQDKSTTMTRVFCKDSHGVVVLCDVTDKISLDATIKWKKSIDDSVTFFDGSPLPMMIIQNKIDLLGSESNDGNYNELISENLELLKDFSEKNGFVMHNQTSVKKGLNINESMDEFLGFIIEKTENLNSKYRKESFLSNSEDKNSIILGESKVGKSKSKDSKCCGE